jgi:hypothetical protein
MDDAGDKAHLNMRMLDAREKDPRPQPSSI